MNEPRSISILYTNWRNETSEREIVPDHIWFGKTEWHPEEQWLLRAHDVAKNAERDFALKDIIRWGEVLSTHAKDALVTELDAFIAGYEKANNSHNFTNVKPFIASDATYWFTDGSYTGIDEIQQAIEATFARIQNEHYGIQDVHFPVATETTAVCTYLFHWDGIVDGKRKSGSGRGTNVLEKRNGSWQIVHEHLSK